ncbi:MAG TPA: aldo/keto reductase [Acidimicrobiales bacterium]|nr:aldo/keto reductase [Acidimicrobiales bacterium]
MDNDARFGALSVGTAPLGGLFAPVDEATARATLEAAADGGITHFDTAPHYGRGLAETRLGEFLAGRDHSCTVSTKVGRHVRSTAERRKDDIFLGAPPGESVFDFSPSGVAEQLAGSGKRLGRTFIDVVLVHDPDDHLDEALGAIEWLQGRVEAGDIGAVGVGTNSPQTVEHLLDRVALEVVLLAGRITLLDDSGEAVARRCATEHVTLLAAGVFQSGILAGDPSAHADYRQAGAAVRARVDELAAVCASHGSDLHTVALNHPRRVTGVASTLVGVRSPVEVTAALEAWNADIPEAIWQEVESR